MTPQPTESAKASISDQLSEAKVAACSHQNSYKAVAVNDSSVTVLPPLNSVFGVSVGDKSKLSDYRPVTNSSSLSFALPCNETAPETCATCINDLHECNQQPKGLRTKGSFQITSNYCSVDKIEQNSDELISQYCDLMNCEWESTTDPPSLIDRLALDTMY